MITRKVWRVTLWEYLQRLKTKSFIIGLFLTPLLMLAFTVVPALLGTISDEETKTIYVFDQTGLIIDSLQNRLNRQYTLRSGEPNYRIVPVAGSHDIDAVRDSLNRLLVEHRQDAFLVIPADVFDSLRVEYRAVNVSNIRDQERLKNAVSAIIRESKYRSAGLDPEEMHKLTRSVDLRSVRVSEKGEQESGFFESFGLAYVFIITMMILILQGGGLMVRSLVEEKSSRLVEILISSCSPTDLLLGKIFGLGLLGLTQLAFWAILGAALVLGFDITSLPLDNLWLMLLYSLLGYMLYTAIFVGMGTLVTTEQEAQQITGYLSMLLILPFMVAIFATQNPDSTVITVLSLIPFLTPTMMVLRLPIVTPPTWEIVLSLVILSGTTVIVGWMAGALFRTGLLLTGKKPTFNEVLRWLRASVSRSEVHHE